MPYLVNVASGQLPFINVFGNDYDTYDGTGVRDYVHVMDLAESHLLALNYIGIKAIQHMETEPSKNTQTKNISIFNVGTGKGYSVLDLIKTFERVNNVNIPLRFSSRRLGDVPVCYANTDLFSEALQWKAKRSLEEMCSSAWNYKKKLL
jgi:UDP-glucose 4-epimerase